MLNVGLPCFFLNCMSRVLPLMAPSGRNVLCIVVTLYL
jgi:hypothetical protein